VEVLSGKAEMDGFAAVPEPSTWALLGLGSVAVLARNVAREEFLSILLLMVALVVQRARLSPNRSRHEPTAWQIWNPGAFQWDADAQNLAVTWDSRETNAFFYYKLP
jgi:hypothetical protein